MEQRKHVSDSKTEQVYILHPQHMNTYGRLFGGILMQWIDEIAAIVAKRHAQCEGTTAAIDNLNFKAGASINDMVVLIAHLTYVGTSSMEVRVDTYTEDLSGERHSINRAYLIFVAIDKDGHPVKVPGLIIETESEKAEWEGGKKRYELRKQRRREGY